MICIGCGQDREKRSLENNHDKNLLSRFCPFLQEEPLTDLPLTKLPRPLVRKKITFSCFDKNQISPRDKKVAQSGSKICTVAKSGLK